MKPVVNLGRVRKARERAELKKIADQNAVKCGRTKAQRLLETARNESVQTRLDQQKFDDSDV
ncbi:DUF4169 family protein [Roseisalinus antarcticus]|uniref:DUF4169 domain-containing protein n=1 Tax=Roseisalinus antarcticus TaxID=254357 RepID=A0A1Y5TT54_9RHOB|nr:DUF4169 family protein [Roseisalinus antarcticus]SLN71750.1 hypothetical protein ROA7023_03541 [Roseisalinus antarcticus]